MKLVRVDGGMGRVICAVPAIEKLAKTDEVVVQIAGHGWIFDNNPNIKKCLSIEDPDVWDEYIKDGEFITPEPYHNHLYYKQKHHLIQSFDYLINGEEEMSKPKLYLSEVEEEFGKSMVETVKEQMGVDKIVVLQPFGASANAQVKYHDETGRSLPYEFVKLFPKKMKDCGIFMMGFGDNDPTFQKFDNCVILNYDMRHWCAMIKHADYFIGCDSVGQHIARAFDIPGTVFLGETYQENIAYPDHFKIIQEKGFPTSYIPMRIADWKKSGKLPFKFTEKEQKELIRRIESHMDDQLEEIKKSA